MKKGISRLFLFFVSAVFLTAGFSLEVYAGNGNGKKHKNSIRLRKRSGESKPYKEGELIVKYRKNAHPNMIAAMHSARGSKIKKTFRRLGMQVIKLAPGMTVEDAAAIYSADPDVEYAEPNFLAEAVETTPNDPGFTALWGMKNTGQTGGTAGADIQATDAWDITTGNGNVVIAVMDTGVNYLHEDLTGNMWTNDAELNGVTGVDDDGNGYIDDIYGIDSFNDDGDPMDDHFHGSHCSGTIGGVGDNGIGVAGVNWDVSIMACKFMDSNGYGPYSDAIECLEYVKAMKDSGVNVVATSNSWGCSYGESLCFSQALYDAIYSNMESGVLFIAAAGNSYRDNDDAVFYPANFEIPNIISVAATDHNDARADFSNWGRGSVHVGAPGVNIRSTVLGNNYASYSGTSMATPHVSGLAALLKADDPSLDWIGLKNLILSGGEDIASMEKTTITGKRINAYRSLTCTDSPLLSAIKYPKSVDEYEIGVPATISALSINCEDPVGPVTVTAQSGGGQISLLDDGVAPDVTAGDGVFTGTWTPVQGTDELTFSSPAGSQTIELPPHPDLVMTLVSGPSSAGIGQEIQINNTVRNQGASSAYNIHIAIYLSPDDTITTDDMYLASRKVLSLAPGEEDNYPYTKIDIPVIAGGAYYVGAIADYFDSIDEVTAEAEGNNTLTGNQITVHEDYSDLIVHSVSGPLFADVGDVITVSSVVRNQGAGDTYENFFAGAYLSTDSNITTDDTLIFSRYVPHLAPGAEDANDMTFSIPAYIADGVYYIGVIADYPGYVVNEGDKTNNTGLGNQISIGIAQPGPDLVMTAVSGPASADQGEQITVSNTVKNIGTDDAVENFKIGLYLSDDTIITEDDTYIGERSVAGLASAAESADGTVVTIPAGVADGVYYLGAIADKDDDVSESREDDNRLTGNEILIGNVSTDPDLVMTNVSGPSSANSGDQITINHTVMNQGLGDVQSYSYVLIYLSADSVITSQDSLIASQHVTPGSLESGESKSNSTTVAVPGNYPGGTYYIGAIADGYNAVVEADETNNALAGNQIQITTPSPDLVMTNVSGPSSANSGDQITVDYTVTNQGPGDASAGSYVKFYLSTDPVITTGDTYLASSFISATDLESGESRSGSTNINLSAFQASGTYYIGAIADANNSVAEGDETNNTLAGNQIQITRPYPDLVMTNVSGPSGANPGDQITIDYTVTNQGQGDVFHYFYVYFYLSTDPVITSGDTHLTGVLVSAAGMEGGASRSGSTNVTIPVSSGSGTYYIGAIADTWDHVEESDETNNALAGSQIQIP